MVEKLKPCPFCGNSNQNPRDPFALVIEETPDKITKFVCCGHCYAEGPGEETDAAAITAWNTRAPIENEGSNT